MEIVTEDVKTVKSTIKKFLELIRNIFNADVCYLYLINNAMDDHEKGIYLRERIRDIKNVYSEFNEDLPSYLMQYDIKDSDTFDKELLDSVDIIKYISVAKKNGVEGWEFGYDNRPVKYVVFKEFNGIEESISDEGIRGEGLTAYMVRTKKQLLFNNHDEINKHPSSAFLNSNKGIAKRCQMMIGFPLTDEKGHTIGVLKIENYSKKDYRYTDDNKQIIETKKYIPLLIRLIKSSEKSFQNNSYKQLFRGMELVENLKKMNPQGATNKSIHEATLHLFLVLERNELIGYDEILERITDYVIDISEQLSLKGEMTDTFERNLSRFRKHEALLLSGLNSYRDHFMHQFHVFVTGYIIINELGIDVFKSHIQDSMHWILSPKNKDFATESKQYTVSEDHVLRIWFLTAFYHDHAYVLEKIDKELERFFNDVLGYSFSVKFNWERLLVSEGKFSMHLCDLLKYFDSVNGTNPDILLTNYLNAIINIHDHGVLGALLLIHHSSKLEGQEQEDQEISIKNECLYAALAISLHNQTIYKDLKEGDRNEISFESFPIAFLLAFCDTAQSFGRLEMSDGLEVSKYPVIFFGIDTTEKEEVIYKLKYDDPNKVPECKDIKGWAKDINNHFRSYKYSFKIQYYKENRRNPICILSF
jgi:hypothetical protein